MPVKAEDNCISALQNEAEQGLRIRAELMVIALNCQHMWPKDRPNIYETHQKTMKRLDPLFEQYENVMLRVYEGDEAKLNALLTKYSNDAAAGASRLRPDVFCSKYATRIDKATELDQKKMRGWAQAAKSPEMRPICASH